MEPSKRLRNNILGDIRAERDAVMLNKAFFPSHDYHKLINSSDLNLVVGRRGTGKSALVWKLTQDWGQRERTSLIVLVPEESQVQAMRSLFTLFGTEFNRIRSASRIAWQYALMMEVASALQHDKKISSVELIQAHLKRWRSYYGGTTSKLREILTEFASDSAVSDVRLGDLAKHLQLNQVHEALSKAMAEVNREVIILLDRLDEGYEPDDTGTAIVDGLVQIAIDLESYLSSARAYVFLRDNIFRAVTRLDQDYSRNLEGQVMRLHWDESQLYGLVCNRLRAAFQIDQADDRQLWNRCTARGLQGMDGFKKCLQLTLYRPRDVVSLLNNAFIHARDHNRDQIIDEDIEATAKEISQIRYDDLIKEYEGTFPGLSTLVKGFSHRNPELEFDEACSAIADKLSVDTYPPDIQRHFRLIEQPDEAIRSLYGMGFLGVKNSSGNYVFCHDGKNPDKEMAGGDRLLIHPCYWMALNATRNNLNMAEAAEIFDEYDIEVNKAEVSRDGEVPELQRRGIGRLMGELDRIPKGREASGIYEDWCLRSLRVLFAGSLRNFEMKPNGAAVQRRDVVALNPGETSVWNRIIQDYGSRQILFEVKNFAEIGPDEFRQASTYLTGNYGKLCFVVTRDDDFVLRSGKELDWVKEIYHTQGGKMVVKFPGAYVVKLLSKLRSKEKKNAPNEAVETLLDTYERNYLSLPSTKGKKRKEK